MRNELVRGKQKIRGKKSRFEVRRAGGVSVTGQERTFGLGRNNWNYGQSASFEGPINQGWKHEHPVARSIGPVHATSAARLATANNARLTKRRKDSIGNRPRL